MNPDQQQPVTPAPQPQMPVPAPNVGMTPPVAPTPMGGPAVGGGKKMNKNMMIGIIIAVLLVAAGAAYGVYAYVSNLPDNLMKSAVNNIKDSKTLGGTFKVVSGASNASITLNGDFALNTDPSNAKNAEAIIGIGTGSARVGITALGLNDVSYLKFSNLESFDSILSAYLPSGSLPATFKNLDDQWFSLTQDDFKTITQAAGGNSNVSGVSAEDLKKVLSIYDQHPLIKADKTYADEVIDGSNSAHFNLKADKNESVAFLQAVKDAKLSTITVTDADIANAKNSTAAATSTLDVWISRDTKQFKQVRLVDTEKDNPIDITLTLTNKLPTFDKFEKPAGARSLTDLYTLLLGSSLPAN